MVMAAAASEEPAPAPAPRPAAAAPPRLVVRNPISGESCDLGEVSERSLPVLSIKVRIQERWKVPPIAQRLLLEGRALPDRQLVPVPKEARELLVDMVLCLKPIISTLHTGCPPGERMVNEAAVKKGHRLAVIQALEQWQPKGHQELVRALFRLLKNDWHTGERTLCVLPLVAERGDKMAVDEARKLLRMGGMQAFYGARALGLLAQKGDLESFALLSLKLTAGAENGYSGTFPAVLDSMCALAPDDASMVKPLLAAKNLWRPDSLIKLMQLLPKFAEKGCKDTIAFLSSRLLRKPCTGFAVQRAVVEALGLVAKRADESVVGMVCPHLESRDEGLRLAAARALGSLAEESNDLAIAGLTALLQDDSEEVRSAATLALRQIVGPERGQEEVALGCTEAALEIAEPHEDATLSAAAEEARRAA